jgi:hypothetical protein
MARGGDLDGVDEALERLQAEVDRLVPALSRCRPLARA